MPPVKTAGRAADQKTDLEEYEAWYCAQIQEAIDECDAGLAIPDEQFRKEMEAHLRKLHRKHGRKAA